MDARTELTHLLRPAAAGLYVVSTGLAEQRAVQRKLYGVDDDAAIERAFQEALDRVASARVLILGVPSDVGAGYRRGANLGPQAVRGALLDDETRSFMQANAIVDVGDVRVVPQLLHDEMLSTAQIDRTRAALYDGLPLPVSPLSIEERALGLLSTLAPAAKVFVLGGDHSVAWPVAAHLHRVRRDRWGVVQPDAHTDLLPHRLGVPYCFATWSYHANELLGRDGRMVQVGTRASGRDRGHWESSLAVRQFWAEEILRDPDGALDAVMAHLQSRGVESVYFTNDIDGTDAAWADATGTPEAAGLTPEWIVALIRRLGALGICAADVVEVAPPLGPDGGARTVALAARYVRETLRAMV